MKVNESGRLEIGGCDCAALAEKYGTPLYIMDEDYIRSVCRAFRQTIAQTYGAGNMERFREVESYTKKCCLAAGVIATVLYFVFREEIISLFISDSDVIAYGVQMLIAYMLSGPVIGILFVNMNCMQSVGHAFPATVLSVLRQGILLIPLLYLLRALFGLNGVILGQSVTDYIAVILSIFMWRKIRGRVEKKQPEAAAGEPSAS